MAEPMLAHNVFFALRDGSPAARQKLVDACKTYLSSHPGIVFFASGVLADELKRDVNVRDFDVGLHIVFLTKSHHDLYQNAPLHDEFIEKNKDNWKQVRVFDSLVQTVPPTGS